MKKRKKILFAIYKKSIHLGNSYGRTKDEAIKVYLKQSYSIQIPNITIEEILKIDSLNNFKAIKAISEVHYFKSKFLRI
jgi:hypothetical protein